MTQSVLAYRNYLYLAACCNYILEFSVIESPSSRECWLSSLQHIVLCISIPSTTMPRLFGANQLSRPCLHVEYRHGLYSQDKNICKSRNLRHDQPAVLLVRASLRGKTIVLGQELDPRFGCCDRCRDKALVPTLKAQPAIPNKLVRQQDSYKHNPQRYRTLMYQVHLLHLRFFTLMTNLTLSQIFNPMSISEDALSEGHPDLLNSVLRTYTNFLIHWFKRPHKRVSI
jgi:hypothetical protein